MTKGEGLVRSLAPNSNPLSCHDRRAVSFKPHDTTQVNVLAEQQIGDRLGYVLRIGHTLDFSIAQENLPYLPTVLVNGFAVDNTMSGDSDVTRFVAYHPAKHRGVVGNSEQVILPKSI